MTKSALITGASRGIGLGIATRLAKQGYGLTINARHPERLESAAAELRATGARKVMTVAGDMADADTVSRIITTHGTHFESLTALVLNAGMGSAGNITDYPMRRFDKALALPP